MVQSSRSNNGHLQYICRTLGQGHELLKSESAHLYTLCCLLEHCYTCKVSSTCCEVGQLNQSAMSAFSLNLMIYLGRPYCQTLTVDYQLLF